MYANLFVVPLQVDGVLDLLLQLGQLLCGEHSLWLFCLAAHSGLATGCRQVRLWLGLVCGALATRCRLLHSWLSGRVGQLFLGCLVCSRLVCRSSRCSLCLLWLVC